MRLHVVKARQQTCPRAIVFSYRSLLKSRRNCAVRGDQLMKPLFVSALMIVLLVGLVGIATAAEDSLSGTVMCAKCALKKADAKECQDVLVVKDGDNAAKEYYITKNAVLKKFGHTCKGEKMATVTGTVTEKDGKMWITATKMEEQK
jgi:hypothetical protein